MSSLPYAATSSGIGVLQGLIAMAISAISSTEDIIGYGSKSLWSSYLATIVRSAPMVTMLHLPLQFRGQPLMLPSGSFV
ncbi:hypothetical protein EMCRGX_G034005 [Ephydatia muelleri]